MRERRLSESSAFSVCYGRRLQGVIVQSHAVSGMSMRKELGKPDPRCKREKSEKSHWMREQSVCDKDTILIKSAEISGE